MTDSVDRLGSGSPTYETYARTEKSATFQPSLTSSDARAHVPMHPGFRLDWHRGSYIWREQIPAHLADNCPVHLEEIRAAYRNRSEPA